jgi:WD40 repeat protein/serine/threonine protein kinase
MQQQNGTPAAPPAADSMTRALEEYLAAAEAGTAPPRDEFLARYPQLAEDLDACLAALRFIGRAADGPRSVAAGLAEVQSPEQVLGQLGDFRIVREVGRGGMGVVYEAQQVSLGRRVALKVLPFAATMDPRQLQRFHNEARAAAALDHPHIVHVHAVGCERAVHFYAMQFIEGQTLAALIAGLRQPGGQPVPAEEQSTTPHAPGPAAPAADTAPRAAAATERAPVDRAYFRRVAELGIQAAEALEHAHGLGIIHRDVKPANLLVDGRGGLWVADFGLAHIQSDARLTMTGDLVGTLRYMSPEQALAKRVVVDHRTDVYSLGATLYELLTLEPAFGGNDRQELLRQIAFEEPRPPRRLNKAVPAELETIVLKAMEKNPSERYAAAKDLADDLRRFLKDEPIRARRPTPLQRARKWGRRHPSVTWSAGIALVLTAVASVLAAVFFQRQETEQRRLADDANTQRGIAEQKAGEALRATQDPENQRTAALGAKQDAERQRNAVYQNLYYADIRLGLVDWDAGNLARLSRKLRGHLPQKGRDDLRGWEWYYLLSLCHQDERTLTDHTTIVTSVAWCPDGRYLASTSYDGVSRVWDTKSWRPLQIFAYAGDQIRCFAWSPDSQRLAWGTTADDSAVYVWYVPTNEIKTLRGHSSSVWTVAWSPDGKRLASAGLDKTIRIWEPATGLCRDVLKIADGHILEVAWSPDGKRLASAINTVGAHEGVTIWDCDSWKVLRDDVCRTRAHSVAWSPDGKQLAVGTEAGTCLLYRAADWTLAAQWDAAKGEVDCVAWSPDGSRLASGGTDGLVKVWAPENGTCRLTLRGHLHSVKSLAWEPNGRRLASGSMDGYVKVWPVSPAAQPRCLDGKLGSAQAIAWGEERDTLRSYDAASGSIALWNVVTGQRLGQTSAVGGRFGRLSGGGGLVAVTPADDSVARILLCETRSGKPVRTVNIAPRLARLLWSSALSPDSSRLALTGTPLLEIVDLRENEVRFRWEGTSWATAVSWSPDGRLVAVAGGGDESDGGGLMWVSWVHVFDPEKQQRLLKLRHGTNRVVATAVAWSPDGKRLVSGDRAGLAEVWEVPTGRKTGSTQLHTSQVNALAWSPDGRRVASGAQDQTVCVWDPGSGEELLRFDVRAAVAQLEWSADGHRLAAACADGTIRIWDASIGYEFIHSKEYYTDEVRSLCEQAEELVKAGRQDDAIARLEQVVEESKAKLGPDHPVTLDSQYRLSVPLLEHGPKRRCHCAARAGSGEGQAHPRPPLYIRCNVQSGIRVRGEREVWAGRTALAGLPGVVAAGGRAENGGRSLADATWKEPAQPGATHRRGANLPGVPGDLGR